MSTIEVLNMHDIEKSSCSEDKNDSIKYAHRVHCHSQGGSTHWIACSNCMHAIDYADKCCKFCGSLIIENEN